MNAELASTRAYHERTKHRLDAYARGPRYLDWDQQPDPFRRFAGAPVLDLPLLSGGAPPAGRTLESVAAVLELSLGLSAWKQFGPNRWALRCNPSSGNLHPTEGYLVASGIDGLADGVYHYAPREHALEHRADLVPGDSAAHCLIGLSSIAWREAWKYGERAFRYVQLDAGHALGAIRYAAAALGLRVERLAVTDAEISRLLGLDRPEDFTGAEVEHPELLLRIHAGRSSPREVRLPITSAWRGQANALSGPNGDKWPVIEDVTAATVCTTPSPRLETRLDTPNPVPAAALIPLIKQRRSAQAFSGQASVLPRDTFHAMLDAALPRRERVPWDVWNLPVRTHLALFVHRVEGLAPGLYALPRHDAAEAALRTAMDPAFRWRKPDGCPASLPLFQLLEGDARKAARALSCHQEIAAASAFSLGMLVEFEAGLAAGAHVYRELYWEAGLIGQVLYLEAEAVGMRGTGIGCFFDDSVHELFGLTDTRFQSFYHFTIGSAVTDPRLETLPPYAHLADGRRRPPASGSRR
ncbi:MAG: SagB family peptide dehydrogenase [Thiotrichales bacterium]